MNINKKYSISNTKEGKEVDLINYNKIPNENWVLMEITNTSITLPKEKPDNIRVKLVEDTNGKQIDYHGNYISGIDVISFVN